MYVYRFLNKYDEVIYIGKSKDVMKRLKQHKHLSLVCYLETEKIQCTKLKNNDESSIYERYLINKISPKYNREYSNNSKFSFELPEIEWSDVDYKFKGSIEIIDIQEEWIECNDDIDFLGYYICSKLGNLTKSEDDTLRIILAGASLGILSLRLDESDTDDKVIYFLSVLKSLNYIDIKYKEGSKFPYIIFNNSAMLGENINMYNHLKSLSDEDKKLYLNKYKN